MFTSQIRNEKLLARCCDVFINLPSEILKITLTYLIYF